MKMRTPYQRWQLAGCPTIPQKYYPYVGYWQARAKMHESTKQAVPKNEAKKGWLHKAVSTAGRFLQRRRA